MPNTNSEEHLPAAAWLRASKVGVPAALQLLAWAIGFSQFKPDLDPVTYWSWFTGVCILIVAVPSWWVGRRAGRDALERRSPPA